MTCGNSSGEGVDEVKERPIIFSGPMVREILDGRKTQTRRIIKPQPKLIESSGRWYWEKALDVHGNPLVDASRRWWEYYGTSPYGKPGDRLWVRETHYVWSAGYKDGSGRFIAYRATDPDSPCSWTPSIHMPRWASRITLEVTGIRVERLQDIDESDAWREGVQPATAGMGDDGPLKTHRTGFVRLWNELNAKRAPWDSNPWVWVVSFRPLPTEGK